MTVSITAAPADPATGLVVVAYAAAILVGVAILSLVRIIFTW